MIIVKSNSIRLGLGIISCLLFGFLLTSCSKKIRFDTSLAVPSAEGYIKIKKDSNKNYSIDVYLENLVDPSRLQPPKTVYVVWLQTEKNGIKNLGQLKSSTGLFSSTREGELNAITPYKPIKLFITAEERSDLEYPGMQSVLTTRDF